MRKFVKIKNLRSAGLLLALMTLSNGLKAQQVPLYNQYFQQRFLAYASQSAFVERPALSVVYRGQFSGIEGAPKAYAVSYANKLGTDMGFGLNITGNDIGFISQTKVQGGLSYALYNKGSHSLSLGALAGISLFSINEDIISPESFNDPLLVDLIGNNGAALGIDFSISYKYKDFGIDVAAPALVNESLSDDEYVQINEDNVPDYIAGAYYRFELGSGVSVTPNVTWRYREVIGSEFDVLARFNYKQKFQADLGYRDNYGATIGVGIYVKPSILFTYNYDFGQSDVPFLADGFNEFALHFTFKNKEERLSRKYAEGESVLNRLRAENIYDKSLIPNTDQRLAVDYLASLESAGSKGERRMAGQARFDEILDGMRKNEQAKLQAQVDAEKSRQQALIDAQAAAEKERLEAEEMAAREKAEQAKAAVPEPKEEAKVETKGLEERATEAAISTLPEKEQARVREVNKLVGPEVLMEIGDSAHPGRISSIQVQYVVVIASYPVDSRYSRLFVNQIKPQYGDVKIFASRKRGLDYVYLGGYNDYATALGRMQETRKDTRFKDAWVHIIRLSK
uniref:PorP/SprF family type IX secretion system membrane protein n=1 Tax=Roseivirga sp. TaxID=1964215 RepID=UPI0040475285